MSEQSTQGTFCWHEIATTDPGVAKSFYTKLVGWKTKEMDMGPAGKYTMFQNGDGDVGGIVSANGGKPHWLVYIGVEDVDQAASEAESLGGKVRVPPTDIPPGRFAVLEDPAGAEFAIFKPTAS